MFCSGAGVMIMSGGQCPLARLACLAAETAHPAATAASSPPCELASRPNRQKTQRHRAFHPTGSFACREFFEISMRGAEVEV